jgi:hypothetical protein
MSEPADGADVINPELDCASWGFSSGKATHSHIAAEVGLSDNALAVALKMDV